MTRKEAIVQSEPTPSSAPSVGASCPKQRSNHRIDEIDAQIAWEAHIVVGRITVR